MLRPAEFWAMTVGDWVAAERGYWDARALEEQSKAWQTMLLLSPYRKSEELPEIKHYIIGWAAKHLGLIDSKEQQYRTAIENYQKIALEHQKRQQKDGI